MNRVALWVAMLLAAPQALCGGQRVAPSLVPSIFAPESAPAHSISHLSGFVLAITGGIFVLVAGLLALCDGSFPPPRQ